jgi:hypothetical protein
MLVMTAAVATATESKAKAMQRVFLEGELFGDEVDPDSLTRDELLQAVRSLWVCVIRHTDGSICMLDTDWLGPEFEFEDVE